MNDVEGDLVRENFALDRFAGVQPPSIAAAIPRWPRAGSRNSLVTAGKDPFTWNL